MRRGFFHVIILLSEKDGGDFLSELVQKLFVWNIEELKQLNESSAVVRNEQSGEIMVKKRLDNINAEIMQKLCSIRHKNLAAVIKVTEENGAFYSYSEFVPGRSIQSYLDEGKIFSEEETLKIALQICDGLRELHSNGIIHRDITAANIILSYDGNVKIIDYGIARTAKENASRDTYILGTAGYAAPEQFGFSQTDERTDIYAVGVLLNMLLTGKFPNEEICSGKFKKIVKRCTSMDSSDRFSSVNELENELSEPKVFSKNDDGFPGFRSHKLIIKILASLIYFIIIFVDCALVSSTYTSKGLLHAILQCINLIVAFAIPFCLICNPYDIQGKIKHFSAMKDSTKIAVRVIFSIVFLLGGFFIMLSLF